MPKAEGGLPISRPIWSLSEDPTPLSLRDISPLAGGEGMGECCQGLLSEQAAASLPPA